MNFFSNQLGSLGFQRLGVCGHFMSSFFRLSLLLQLFKKIPKASFAVKLQKWIVDSKTSPDFLSA